MGFELRSTSFYSFWVFSVAQALGSVRPDWAIFCSLGYLLKPLGAINLPNSPTFLGNFCKGVKINHFPSEIIFGQLLKTFGNFLLVTLLPTNFIDPKFTSHPSPSSFLCRFFQHLFNLYFLSKISL